MTHRSRIGASVNPYLIGWNGNKRVRVDGDGTQRFDYNATGMYHLPFVLTVICDTLAESQRRVNSYSRCSESDGGEFWLTARECCRTSSRISRINDTYSGLPMSMCN